MLSGLKVTIFGAGGTGGTIAHLLATQSCAQVVLIDVAQDLAEGKAIDINQSGAILGSDSHVIGGCDFELVEKSDIVVVTAGIGRRPGLDREQLLDTNAQIIADIGLAIRTHAPNAFVIVLTNPADILTRIMLEVTGLPTDQVMGQGGVLDSARLSHWIARLAGVSVQGVHSMVLGGHGDHMVPVRNFASIHGIPATHLLSEDAWQTAVSHTRYGGGEILSKFKTHGAAVTPAYAVMEMIQALCSPVPYVLPISAQSQGHYGLPKDVYIGLPVKLSRHGIEQILDVHLAENELEDLYASAVSMQNTYKSWKQAQLSI